jgi:hypothetical protein
MGNRQTKIQSPDTVPLKVTRCSNGNASETKANESFDNGVFFDIEAKRTPSIVSKLFSKRSEHIRYVEQKLFSKRSEHVRWQDNCFQSESEHVRYKENYFRSEANTLDRKKSIFQAKRTH